jgi:hypothetical protein
MRDIDILSGVLFDEFQNNKRKQIRNRTDREYFAKMLIKGKIKKGIPPEKWLKNQIKMHENNQQPMAGLGWMRKRSPTIGMIILITMQVTCQHLKAVFIAST